MKTYFLLAFTAVLLNITSVAVAQYSNCPHGTATSGSQPGYLDWRFRDPNTNQVLVGAPHPLADKVYKMEVYAIGVPSGKYYNVIGIQGFADGFKVYNSLTDANNNANPRSDADIQSGIGQDKNSVDQTATWYIRTVPSSDPSWSGQITAFKAMGVCWDVTPSNPNKYYKKTLIYRP